MSKLTNHLNNLVTWNNLASVPKEMRAEYFQKQQEKALLENLKIQAAERKKQILKNYASYIAQWKDESKAEKTDHDTYVYQRSHEEWYGIKRLDHEKRYLGVVNRVLTWFVLAVGPLKRQGSENPKESRIDMEDHWSEVLSVWRDHKSRDQYNSKLALWWFGSHSFSYFSDAAKKIAKEFCDEHGYEIERVILDIPEIRWLVYKKDWGKSFYWPTVSARATLQKEIIEKNAEKDPTEYIEL